MAAGGKDQFDNSYLSSDDQMLKPNNKKVVDVVSKPSDTTIPLPLNISNGVFFTIFFSVVYFLLTRWREKIRNSTPLHVVTMSEMAAIFTFVASFIYLLGFFGMSFVQPATFSDDEEEEEEEDVNEIVRKVDTRVTPCGAALESESDLPIKPVLNDAKMVSFVSTPVSEEDEVVIQDVVSGKTPSYSLESKLGDCKRAAFVRRVALERITGKSLEGLPLDGFDYESILGQCCEMPVGYVQIPVGIAGPLLLDGKEFAVPMATTEGCLVASTNRGCKAIYVSGGATSVLLKDGMTRAPVVRFGTARRAADLKFFLEDPINFETLASVFNK